MGSNEFEFEVSLDGYCPSLPAVRQLVRRCRARAARAAGRFLFSELNGVDSRLAWVDLRDTFAENVLAFSNRIGQVFDGEELQQVLGLLLIPLAQNVFKDSETQLRFHRLSEKMGYHLVSANFYSPIPTLAELEDHDWSRPISDTLRMDDAAQLDLLRRLAPWTEELAQVPAEPIVTRPHQYFWTNGTFDPTDAAIYYAVIREFGPRRIVEVGGGMSTMVAAQAAQRNWPTVPTRVTCLEPYPAAILREGFPGLEQVIVERVQKVSIELFEDLRENDILFIDSTHVSKAGSDVNHLFFNVLPRLHSGVIIHFHDIFIPWDYPSDWITEKRLAWNEQYLLLGFLSCNPSFQILLGTSYMTRVHPDEVRRLFPVLPSVGGCSFWIRRV
jgi:predicted O-methyltransferase YrrM